MHALIGLEPLGDSHRVLVMFRHAHGQRLHPARERVGRRGLEDAAKQLPRRAQPRHQFARSRERSRRHVAVSIQPLRRRMHHHVDTELEWLLIEWARKRVVDDRHDALLAARGCNRRDVRTAKRRIDGRLEPQHPRLWRQKAGGILELLQRRELRRHAEAAEHIGNDLQRTAVNRGAAHDFVARLQQSKERGARGRHARRRDQRVLGVLENRDLQFGRAHGRIRIARVDVFFVLAVLIVREIRRGIEGKRARGVNRRRQRRRLRMRALAAMNDVSIRMPRLAGIIGLPLLAVVVHAHTASTRSPAATTGSMN